jgi:hypothetical protein
MTFAFIDCQLGRAPEAAQSIEPSNLLMHRIGARIWIARILITWGIIATATGFIHNLTELCSARFLLGVAEAGFFPGIVLYLTYWFRRRGRSRCSWPDCRLPASWARQFPL